MINIGPILNWSIFLSSVSNYYSFIVYKNINNCYNITFFISPTSFWSFKPLRNILYRRKNKKINARCWVSQLFQIIKIKVEDATNTYKYQDTYQLITECLLACFDANFVIKFYDDIKYKSEQFSCRFSFRTSVKLVVLL